MGRKVIHPTRGRQSKDRRSELGLERRIVLRDFPCNCFQCKPRNAVRRIKNVPNHVSESYFLFRKTDNSAIRLFSARAAQIAEKLGIWTDLPF